MNNKGYIKAFTIVEVVVSLVITAIIIAIIYVIFSVSAERLFDFKKQNQQINDLNRMTYGLNKEIFESEKMFITDNMLIFNNYDNSKSQYYFSEDFFVLEHKELIDTFYITVAKLKIDTLKNQSQKMFYQRLQCYLKINEKQTQLNFYKKIYANQLLKEATKNEF